MNSFMYLLPLAILANTTTFARPRNRNGDLSKQIHRINRNPEGVKTGDNLTKHDHECADDEMVRIAMVNQSRSSFLGRVQGKTNRYQHLLLPIKQRNVDNVRSVWWNHTVIHYGDNGTISISSLKQNTTRNRRRNASYRRSRTNRTVAVAVRGNELYKYRQLLMLCVPLWIMATAYAIFAFVWNFFFK